MEHCDLSAERTSTSSCGDSKWSRPQWMAVLASAPLSALEEAWRSTVPQPAYSFLRQPETGLIMVQGRIGGTGRPFNLGEMTVTRCTVCLDHGTIGQAYVAGRSSRHAELAALLDGVFQDGHQGSELVHSVLSTLQSIREERNRAAAAEVAATKVDFFTMTRGDE